MSPSDNFIKCSGVKNPGHVDARGPVPTSLSNFLALPLHSLLHECQDRRAVLKPLYTLMGG